MALARIAEFPREHWFVILELVERVHGLERREWLERYACPTDDELRASPRLRDDQRPACYHLAMSFTYPQFNETSWSATFDSYDQRNDDVYYVITLADGKRFMAEVSVAWAGDDWTTPEFTSKLRQELERIALSGKTNTTHTGGVVPSV